MYKISKMVWASKTATAKITAKITTTALLFFLALFTLTTQDLKAQAKKVQDICKLVSSLFCGFGWLSCRQQKSFKPLKLLLRKEL